MTITADHEVDIFVGSRIGSFKHVKYYTEKSKNSKKCIENLVDIKSLQKDDCITCLQWGNQDQTEILIGKKNQQIQVYSTTEGITATHTADFAPGHVVGLGRCKRKLLAATSSGVVRIWSKKHESEVQTGGKLDVMKVSEEDPTMFATGGEENDLKIWRIGTAEPLFAAKNLANDWLQLRQPVWVSGLCFLPGSDGALAAVCSRHGYVRIYDTRAQRRPVANVTFPGGMPATCIVPSFNERQVLVGFGRGQLRQVDLRTSRPDKGYQGAGGAITSVAISGRLVLSASLDRHLRIHQYDTKELLYKTDIPSNLYILMRISRPDKGYQGAGGAITSVAISGRLVFSASLDRHLRIHQYDTKEMLYKHYLTSKLSSLLVKTEGNTPLRNAPEEVKEEDVKEEEEEEIPDDLDALFERMETVGDKPKKKIHLSEDAPPSKKVKPSTEGSTEASDDAIAQLLRSTEKQKRKRDKKKKEKKAKSVFHNA